MQKLFTKNKIGVSLWAKRKKKSKLHLLEIMQ